MKYTFIEQWSPSAWPFSCFPLPSPSYAFYFWSIMLALHVYSHTNVKIFLYFKSKTTCNGKSWYWLPDSNRLSYHRENCCKLFTCRFADKSLRFSRRKTPGGQRCKVFHIPWNSIQICQREKLGEKCPFFAMAFVGSSALTAIQGDWPWASSSLAVSTAFTLCWEPDTGCSWKAVVKVRFGDSRERKRLPHFITALSKPST